ncbi:hypothetical protein [Vreelandella glaciei]|uniref:hypothetical protein n=1 Tax=Vreelandella glaciei TaxID=186761 RepID=UPI0030EB92F7|tara:strand:- start:2842 stop:3192 length:351 start_codon:yes stop_codon:yes gene_type:complete
MSKQATVPNRYRAGFIDALDARTSIAQEMRQRYAEVVSDLGGEVAIGYVKRGIIERYLWAEYWLRTQERQLAEGKEIDIGKYVQASNNIIALSNKLGLERQAREVSLSDYIGKASQ